MGEVPTDVTVRDGSIAELKPHQRNARKHNPRNVGAIEKSLQENGFGRSLLVARDGTILAGNATSEALGNTGFEDAIIVESDGTRPIVHVRTDLDPTDEMAIKLALADNRSAELAEWDTDEINRMKEEGFDFSDFWTTQEFNRAFGAKGTQDKVSDDDTPVDLNRVARSKPGDLYCLGGRHYLMCGDATNPDNITQLLSCAPTNPTLLVTSPPYGVGKEYDNNNRTDELDDWRHLMRAWIGLWSLVVPLAAINLADLRVGPNQREVHTYGEMSTICDESGWSLIASRIWVKPPAWNMPYYAHSYRPVDDFEYIGFYGDAPYKSRLNESFDWRYRGVWEMASVASNKDHPAKFPLELPERCILLLTDPGDVVCDPFNGSGTSLMACDGMDRIYMGMELSPFYTDLTLDRYENATGTKAELIEP